jgi:hypothetical protein
VKKSESARDLAVALGEATIAAVFLSRQSNRFARI